MIEFEIIAIVAIPLVIITAMITALRIVIRKSGVAVS